MGWIRTATPSEEPNSDDAIKAAEDALKAAKRAIKAAESARRAAETSRAVASRARRGAEEAYQAMMSRGDDRDAEGGNEGTK